MAEHYITQKNFNDLSKNMTELIDVLNHRMTEIENGVSIMKTDLAWIKKLSWAALSVITTISGVVIKFLLFS